MNALSGPFSVAPDSGESTASEGSGGFGHRPAGVIGTKWAVLHDAAAVVATLAGVEGEVMASELRDFPAAIHEAGGWRLARAMEALDDLSAIMESGLAALLALSTNGALSSAPAEALWEEFEVARAALLALLPPPKVAAA